MITFSKSVKANLAFERETVPVTKQKGELTAWCQQSLSTKQLFGFLHLFP